MAKFSKIQWALASNITARARAVIRDAKKLSKLTGIAYDYPTVPNREQLRKMPTEEAERILDDLSTIKTEADLRLRYRGGGNYLSNYEVKQYKSAEDIVEERKAAMRQKMNITTSSGTMGSEADTLTRPMQRLDENNLPEDFEAIRKRILSQAEYGYMDKKNALYRANYFIGLGQEQGFQFANEIKWITRNMTDFDFYVASASIAELEIRFYYTKQGEDYGAYQTRILQAWKEAADQNYVQFWSDANV